MKTIVVVLNGIGIIYCLGLGYLQPDWPIFTLLTIYLLSTYIVLKRSAGVGALIIMVVNLLVIVVGIFAITFIIPVWEEQTEGIVKIIMVFIPFLFLGPPIANVIAILFGRKRMKQDRILSETNG